MKELSSHMQKSGDSANSQALGSSLKETTCAKYSRHTSTVLANGERREHFVERNAKTILLK